MNPITVIDVNTYLPLREFITEVGSQFVREGFKSIFSELAGLDDSDRQKRINEYNKSVIDYTKNVKTKRVGIDLATDTVGIWLPFLGTAKSLAKFLYSKARDSITGDRQICREN